MATIITGLSGDLRLLPVVDSEYFPAPVACGVRPAREDLTDKILISSIIQPQAIQEMLLYELNKRGVANDRLDPLTLQTPLAGGYILACGGTFILLPGCCADLGDISSWDEAARYREAEWKEIWIGHPCISVRYEGERLIISETHEPCDRPSGTGKYSLTPQILMDAIARATEELRSFARLLSADLAKYADEVVARQLALNLAGL
jgi:hypothetical protein